MPGAITGSNVSVNPSSTTVYTITGSSGSCTSAVTTTIVVNPTPTISASASPASICNGSSSTLTASGANTYTWQPGSLNGSIVTVTPSVNTPYIVTGESAAGCLASQTVIVSVNSVPSLTISSSSNTLCSGGSATLTGSGTLAYTWTPGGSTSATLAVNPPVTTTYTLTGSNGFGCTNTETFVLVVSATPTVVASASSMTVCEGFTTALSASGASSYTWNPGPQIGSLVTVTVTSTTSYTVDGENSGCTASDVITITALPLPTITAVANPTSICAGATATLTASGASSYTWLPLAVTGSSVSDAPSATTVYTIDGVAANGCPASTNLTLNVLPIPTITAVSSATAVCTGAQATLTASGAATYTWEPGTIVGATIAVNPASPTTYTVTGDNGACSSSATISIGINPLPVISAAITPTSVCEGNLVSLSATGGVNYTWTPMGSIGASVTDNPTVSLTYTVTGEDANGCSNTANVSVSVNPNPVLSITPSSTVLCEGSTVTLTVMGAATFTWLPSGANTTTISDTPLTTSNYTVSGTDAIGCIGVSSIQILVVPLPTVSVLPLSSTICAGTSETLTASGATNYTWLPGAASGSVNIVSPLSSTTYTLIGDNGGICIDSTSVTVSVNPLPANVTASVSGAITCATPSVDLFGASTDTNVSYSWSGPSSFTSSAQNPGGVTAWGVYTLSVTDNNTGCAISVTVDVPTDNSIPSVTATVSGSITCANSTVSVTAVHTTTNPGYAWTGPSAFTATTQTAAVTASGD